MTFLPYGDSRSGTWTASTLVSLALHGALIAAMSSNLAQLILAPRDDAARPEIQISLEQTQTDLLADVQDRLRGLDDLPPPSAFDEFQPEDALAAQPGDDAFLPEAPDDLDVAAADALDPASPDDAADTDDADAAQTPDIAEADPVAAIAEADAQEPDTLEAALPPDLPDVPVDPPEPQDAVTADPDEVTPAETAAVADLTEAEDAPLPDTAPEAQPDTVAPDNADAATADIAPDQPDQPADTDAVAAVQPAPVVVDDLSVPLPDAEDTPAIASATPLFSDDGTGAAVPIDDGAIGPETAPLPQLAQDVVDQVVPLAVPDAAVADVGAPTAAPDVQADTVGPEQVAILSLPDPEDAAPAAAAPVDDPQDPPQDPPVDPAAPDDDAAPPDDTVAAVPDAPPAADGTERAERAVRRVPRSPPTARDIAVADLIQRIRREPAPDCLVALPRRIGADSIGLTLMSAQDDARAGFTDRLLTRPDDAEIRQTPMLIDPRQCPVLGLVAANRDYPATRIGIQVERVEVPSGNRLSGTLTNVGQRNLALFLVDNNGVVHSLDRFVTTRDGTLRFDVPVTRVGPGRDTRQLLLAVASDEPLDQLSSRSGERAEDAFGNLSAALVRDVALALLAVDVR